LILRMGLTSKNKLKTFLHDFQNLSSVFMIFSLNMKLN